MQHRNRRRWTALCAVAFAVVPLLADGAFASSAPQAPPATSLIVGLDVANIQTVNAEVAVDEGFFSKEHLDVTFVNLQGDAAISALEQGSIQIGETDPVSLCAYGLGYNLKVLDGGARTDFVLVAADSLKCSTWKAKFPGPLACLVGSVVGTPQLDDNDQLLGAYLIGQAAGCTTGGNRCVVWEADTDSQLSITELEDGVVQAQVSDGSTLPIYAAHHLKVWTVTNAALSPNSTGNAGKLVPLNVTAVPVASADELNARPKVYQGFCQAIVNANAWLDNPANLKRAGVIAQNWLGDGTALSTAMAEIKLQDSANLAHISSGQWRGSVRISPGLVPQPYADINWAGCAHIKARVPS